jgi:hypothetical protein
MPELITEKEANARFSTKTKLQSGGNYGCHVLVFKPDEADILSKDYWMCDDHFRALWNRYSPDHDVGTILIDGDVVLTHEASISDRLMCLVVTGNLVATKLHIFETEFAVYGDCKAEFLTDHDNYLQVHGKCDIGEHATYD